MILVLIIIQRTPFADKTKTKLFGDNERKSEKHEK